MNKGLIKSFLMMDILMMDIILQTLSFSLDKMLIDGLESYGLLVDYYYFF